MISSDHLDMIMAFIVREHRMLRLRETSLPAKELEDAGKLVKCAVQVVIDKTKKEDGGYEAALAKPSRKSLLSREVGGKCKKLSSKQVKLILENFSIFKEAMFKAEDSAKKKVHLSDPKKFDRFYEPKKHSYR